MRNVLNLLKPYLVASCAFLLVALGAAVARHAVLKGGVVISSVSAPSLTGSISQGLYTGGGQVALPQPGKDYNLQDVHYFDNKRWAVAYVKPTDNNFDPGYVVLEERDGQYVVVLGPGSNFDASYQLSMPADVNTYLMGQEAFRAVSS